MKTTFKLKAGTYWIGDTCYIYPDPKWSSFCDIIMDGNKSLLPKEIEPNFVVMDTAWGDGCYPVYRNNRLIGECGVDAGILSVIDIDIAQKWPQWEEKKGLGVVVTIPECELEVFGDEPRLGNFRFADIEVFTDDDGKDEDEDNY